MSNWPRSGTRAGQQRIPTNTVGGGIDQFAAIGHAPEARHWSPGDPYWSPEIESTARVEAFATIDSGIKRPTKVGARTWIFKHAHVGHDAVVGDDCEIATGAILAGYVTIGDRVRVGLGAIILPRVFVADDAVIGAGAVVTRNVEGGATVKGVPARASLRAVA